LARQDFLFHCQPKSKQGYKQVSTRYRVRIECASQRSSRRLPRGSDTQVRTNRVATTLTRISKNKILLPFVVWMRRTKTLPSATEWKIIKSLVKKKKVRLERFTWEPSTGCSRGAECRVSALDSATAAPTAAMKQRRRWRRYHHFSRTVIITIGPKPLLSHGKRRYDLRDDCRGQSPTFGAGWLPITTDGRGTGKMCQEGREGLRGWRHTRFLYPIWDDAVGALKSYAESGAARPSGGR